MLIPWKDEFALGIEEIDEQHKRMLSIINKLFTLFEDEKYNDQDEINKIIKEMTDYANYHFATEEKYFDIFNYEKKAAHLEIHNQYRLKISNWHKCYQELCDRKVFFEISGYLQDWWTWHINNTDREYVAFFKANGVK